MKVKKILVCDGTLDGILTAVYLAYELRYGHENIEIIESLVNGEYDTFELFSEYIDVPTNFEEALKVSSTIQNKVSEEAFQYIVRAALSDMKGRSDVIYRYIILALHIGKDINDYLSNDCVNTVFKLNRNVSLEVHHFNGFLRFEEVGDGILLAKIKPKNNILTLIEPHFSDRLNNENFIIYDEGRGQAAIHQKNEETVFMEMDAKLIVSLKKLKSEKEEYDKLWKAFYTSVSIKERENLELQQNNLPLRFRTYMTEFMEHK